ncbi:hypothetical protein AVEN_189043-1 [Araneus ventricosus]|uniref:Uncharacterized protein n=1 Tax=Araneus ventricosus TaxID=182803 RepID=A0A4Y2RPX8_ARAVE|nr:hypothetical protein AVEN_103684-1 [Araneus ventricosus]GBN77711.1 hypothetical protein AVEN_189043-1 [Araneus ventricosus]
MPRYSALSSSHHVGDIVNQRFFKDPVVKAWSPVKYCHLWGRFGASAPPRFVIPHLHREALSFLRRLRLVEECIKFHLQP